VRGTENSQYLDRSTSTSDRREAQKRLIEWKREAHATRTSASPEVGFAAAASAYMDAGGDPRFLPPLIAHFKDIPLPKITQAMIDEAAVLICPWQVPATRNREIYTPMSAIMRRAGHVMVLRRPKGAAGATRMAWLKPEEAHSLLRAADAQASNFGALCRFLLYTGCRLSEGLRLEWSDLHLEENFAHVRETKNGDPRAAHLPVGIVSAIRGLPVGRGRVFGLHKGGRLYEHLSAAALRAKVDIPSRVAFHIFRHTYGAWMRRYSGLDTTGLVATGAWKSRNAAAVYEHAVTSEEARKADLLPTGEIDGNL
jgi:integrase